MPLWLPWGGVAAIYLALLIFALRAPGAFLRALPALVAGIGVTGFGVLVWDLAVHTTGSAVLDRMTDMDRLRLAAAGGGPDAFIVPLALVATVYLAMFAALLVLWGLRRSRVIERCHPRLRLEGEQFYARLWCQPSGLAVLPLELDGFVMCPRHLGDRMPPLVLFDEREQVHVGFEHGLADEDPRTFVLAPLTAHDGRGIGDELLAFGVRLYVALDLPNALADHVLAVEADDREASLAEPCLLQRLHGAVVELHAAMLARMGAESSREMWAVAR